MTYKKNSDMVGNFQIGSGKLHGTFSVVTFSTGLVSQ